MTLPTHKLMIGLVALMALTRVHHFGDAFSLPDASLAVFFLAGLLNRRMTIFAALLLEAGLLDYVAISQFGVSDACISPAYVFLIPTYAVMWFVGRECGTVNDFHAKELLTTLGLAGLATSAAFMISNMSYYGFSGRSAEVTLMQYVQDMMQYLPMYMSAALLYILCGLAVIKIVSLWPVLDAKQHSVGK